MAEQTKRAAQETVRAAKRAQAVAEADLAHVREELAAANAANALTSHAAEAQLDMDQGRLGEVEAALEAQQLALEAAQRNVARESDRADAAAAAAARRVAELNDAREEIDRLRAALESFGGHRGGRGNLTMASTPADTPGDTPRSDPWTSSTPAPFNPGHRQRPNARPPLNPNPREPSTAAKAAAAAMGRVPASAYRSRSASPSPREGGRGFESLRGHFAENVGADAVDPNPGAVAGRGRSSGSGGGSRQRQRPRRPGRLHDWSDYPYDEDGGGGSSGRARRGGSGARDALDQELANARDVLDLIRGGAASSYAGSDDDSPR